MRVIEVESGQRTCSRRDSTGKERCASERQGASNEPVARQLAVERGDARRRGRERATHLSRRESSGKERCASERQRASNAPKAGQIAVVRRDARQRCRERAMHL